MYQLGIGAACAYVRTVLDELTSTQEIGIIVDMDAADIHQLVENSIVEAVVSTHLNAPPHLIHGKKAIAQETTDENLDSWEDESTAEYKAELETETGIITFTMLADTLLVSSIKVEGSPIVRAMIPEYSAEGRMQLNEYTRGVYDDPRVVLCEQWHDVYKPILKFYSVVNTATTLPKIDLEYIPYPMIKNSIVEVSPQLEYAVLNEVTAMVLNSLNEHEKANIYRSKALAIMGGK